MAIKIVIVDDDPGFRDILRMRLASEPDLEVLETAADGRQAIAAVRRHQPDVIIMDVNMPELDGIETTRSLVFEAPEARVIALSGVYDDRSRLAILEAGASTFVRKDSSTDELLRAVRGSD